MKFQIDDVVVHEVYGVGKVLDIEELTWKQPDSSQFYVVAVGDAKIWVSVEEGDAGNLRCLTPKKDLSAYQQVFQDTPAILEENRYGRTAYISQNKKHVSFQELCVTVRDMTSLSLKKKLARDEAFFLERLTRQLIEEWALSADITFAQAEVVIEKLLQTVTLPEAANPKT